MIEYGPWLLAAGFAGEERVFVGGLWDPRCMIAEEETVRRIPSKIAHVFFFCGAWAGVGGGGSQQPRELVFVVLVRW